MEGYQFAHIEIYSEKPQCKIGPSDQQSRKRNGSRTWTAQQILDEAERLEHAAPHVIPGRPGPEITHGCVSTFAELRTAQKAAARVKETFPYTRKDGTKAKRTCKLRTDAASLYASVVLVPVRTDQALKDLIVRAQAVAALNEAVAHERNRIEGAGGQFMLAVRHWDEEFLHVHVFALDSKRGRVKHLHPGHLAKDRAVQKSTDRKIAKKEANKPGDRAYCDAMRQWQDDLFQEVFRKYGLLRYGPRRERLSRGEYKRAKEAARLRATDEERRTAIQREAAVAAENSRRAKAEIDRARAIKAIAVERAEAFEAGTRLLHRIVFASTRSRQPSCASSTSAA